MVSLFQEIGDGVMLNVNDEFKIVFLRELIELNGAAYKIANSPKVVDVVGGKVGDFVGPG